MPKENRLAGLGEAVESESEPDAKSDDEQTADGDTTNRSGKSGPEPAVEPESGGDSALDSKAESDSELDEASKSDDASEGGEVVERNDGGEAEEATESNAETDGTESTANMEQTTETASGPTFGFEATTAKSIYVRTATLSRLDDAEFKVKSLLRREYDVHGLIGREFHDALVRVAAECPEKIIDAVLERRNE